MEAQSVSACSACVGGNNTKDFGCGFLDLADLADATTPVVIDVGSHHYCSLPPTVALLLHVQ